MSKQEQDNYKVAGILIFFFSSKDIANLLVELLGHFFLDFLYP